MDSMIKRVSESRNRRIVKWTRQGFGKPGEPGDTDVYDDAVWWGYWHEAGNSDTTTPPDVLLPSEEEAMAYALLYGKEYDTHVGPCVLRIECRDNFEVPK